jgi:hypothetical protein
MFKFIRDLCSDTSDMEEKSKLQRFRTRYLREKESLRGHIYNYMIEETMDGYEVLAISIVFMTRDEFWFSKTPIVCFADEEDAENLILLLKEKNIHWLNSIELGKR